MSNRGGKRPGAGRPKGKPNGATVKRTEHATALLEAGVTPLQIMVEMARGERKYDEDILEAAKAAAPYMHPKLSSVDMNAEVTVSHEEKLRELE